VSRRNIRKISDFSREVVALSQQVRALAEDVSKLVDMAPQNTVLARLASGVGAIERVSLDLMLDAASAVLVRLAGADVGTRRILNFIAGSGVALTVTDDTANAEVDITIAATGVPLTDGDKGDITVSGSGATWTIDNSVVTEAKLSNGVALSVLGRSANSSGVRADITGTAEQVLRVNAPGTSLGFGVVTTNGINDSAVTTAKIANNNVTDAKLRDSAALSVIGRAANSSGDPADISATAGQYGHLVERSSALTFQRRSFQALTLGAASGGVRTATLTVATSPNATLTNSEATDDVVIDIVSPVNGEAYYVIVTNSVASASQPGFKLNGSVTGVSELASGITYNDADAAVNVYCWVYTGSTLATWLECATSGGA
jgi:hypothetical protein